MTPAESRRIADLEAKLAALTRAAGNARGLGVNTAFGATHYRTTQLGFEAELTTRYDADTGYGWKRKRLVPGLAEPFTDPGVQLRGDKAFSFITDETLTPGTPGWCEPSPDASGFIFIHGPSNPSGSGSGSDVDGDGTADRRLVGYNYDVTCSGGVLTKTRQPIYQFLGSGLSSYGVWETVGAIGCCECDDDPSDGGPTGGTDPENVICDECFGDGKPHPSPNEPDVPAALTVSWTDLGQSKSFAHDDSTYDWQADATGLTGAAFDGLISATIQLCTETLPTGYELSMNYTDPAKDATIILTMISCDPIMLVGEGAQGRVAVTE